ncbi:MAG TPA: hypothetical protein VFA71_12620 [Terriglobales bacterium]|nr:hypothetical protein [Terriglobales bacterium]
MRITLSFYLLLSLLTPAAFSQTAPVPVDSSELVTEPAHVLVTPEERAAASDLLNRARQNYFSLHEFRTPYVLKVSFNSSGQSLYEGDGTMEEVRLSARRWRWTAHLAGVSAGRLIYDGHVYSTSDSNVVPLRVYMVRTALFAPGPAFATGQMMRSATVNYKGKEITCLLLSMGVPTDPAPRFWVETEYCIDPNSGLLQVWSETPGIYATYDYSDPITFHGRTLARQVTFVEDGKTVLDVHLDSLQEPGEVDPSSLVPTTEMVPSYILLAPQRFPIWADANAGEGDGNAIHSVIIHAAIDGANGKVLEAEALQNSNPALAKRALDIVKRSSNSPTGVEREVFVNVRFHTRQQEGAQNSAP